MKEKKGSRNEKIRGRGVGGVGRRKKTRK